MIVRKTVRHLALGLATALAGISLIGGLRPASAADGELVIVASGGSFERALRQNFYDAFTAKTGIKIRAIAASYAEQWAKAKAMSNAGQTEWDIVTVGIGEDVANKDLLLPMPCDQLTNLATDAIPQACRETTLLRTIGGTVLAYSTEAFPKDKAPKDWQDFWDTKKFPGPRMIPNYGAPYVPMALALLSDGVPLGDVRDHPLDIDRAFRRLDQVKPDVAVWWKTGDQSQQAFRHGDVVMGMIWSGRAQELKRTGTPIDYVWTGASAELSAWGILAKAPHRDAAVQFLNFFLTRPEAHLAFTKEVGWDTVNKAALKENYGSVDVFRQRLDGMVIYDTKWLAAQRATITNRWNEWISR